MKLHGTVALLQARIRSSRLPGKVMMPLQGNSVIEIIIARLLRSEKLDGIIIVTSNKSENDALAYIAGQYHVPCFRGSEKDVLDRFYMAALENKVEHIVRVTGDCPLTDPALIDEMIAIYHQSRVDLLANYITETFPDGLDVSIFSFTALEAAWKNAELPSEREHVVPWILKNSQLNQGTLFKAKDFPCFENLSNMRWAIDEASDYIFYQELVKVISMPIKEIGWRQVLKTIREYPEIGAINTHIMRDEGYKKSLEEDKKYGA